MIPLLALGLSLLVLALVPRPLRPAVLIALVAIEAALAVHAVTPDAFLVAAAAVVAALLAIVVREMLSTFSLLFAPTAEGRREREREWREYDRERSTWEREHRREQRAARRAREHDRLAA